MEQSETGYTFLLPHELPLSFPFDSTRDSLIASTLAPLAISQEDLKKDYPYQYIEFRDKRELETILKGFDTGKIQMNKQQADTLRKLRTTLKRRRDVSEEAFQTELTQKPFLYPPHLSDSTIYTQEFKSALDPRPLPDFATPVSRLPSLRTPNAPPRFECDDKLYEKIKSHEVLTKLFLKRADVDRVQKFRRDVQGKVKEAGSLSSEFVRELERDQESLVDTISKDNDTSVSLDLSLILHQADDVMIPPQPRQDSFPKEAQVMDTTSAEAGVLDENYLHTLEKEKGEDSENVKMDFERSEKVIEKGSREEGSITQDNENESSEQARTPADNRRIRSPTLTPESPRPSTPMECLSAHTTQSEAKVLTVPETIERREKFLRDCRLGLPSNLPSLTTPQPFSITSLGLVKSPTELLSLSYSLQWNPVPCSEVIARIGPLERMKGERIIQRDLKRKARDSRERMTGGVEVTAAELREDLVVEIDGLTVRTDEGDSQNPFQLLYRSPSPAISTLSPVYSPSIHAADHDQPHESLITVDAPSEPIANPPSPTPTSFSTWPSHPPPYTIPRRCASSLLTPTRSSLESPIIPPVINGKALDVDEFGFIGAGATFPSSTPPVSSPSPCPQPTRSTPDQADDEMTREDEAQRDDRGTMQIDLPQTATAPVAGEGSSTAQDRTPDQLAPLSSKPKERTKILGGGGKPSSTFRLSEAMNRFMSSRATEAEKRPERPLSDITAKPASQPKPSRAVSTPDPHSSPPPGSIPFSIPPFLSRQLGISHRELLRVVIFDSVLQMRPLYIALQKSHFELVHRPSRFPSTRYTPQDPHLILSGTSCVCYFKLIDLIGNAVREDPPNSTTLSRQESVFTTLRRFASRYDRILVVLEEQQQSKQSKAVKAYSYTTPVLQGLRQLAKALEDLRSQDSVEGKCGIEVAISKGPEHSAELTRKFAEYLEGEDEKEARPGMKAWGDRTWLLDNPSDDQTKLLEFSSELNEISASAILSRYTTTQFAGMDSDEAIMTLSSICGEERIRRILGVENDVPTSSSSSRPSFAQPAISNLLVDNDTSFSPYKFSLSSIGERRSEAPSGDVRFEDVFDVERYDGER